MHGEQLPVDQNAAVPRECRVELVACPSCVIEWELVKSNFSHPVCGPDYIELSEPSYGPEVSASRICSTGASGKSHTRNVLMRFAFSQDFEHAFDMLIEIKRK